MRLPLVALIAAAAVAVAGCGSSTSSSDAAIDATDARLAVEKAAGVKLTEADMDNVLTDRQMVMLLVLDEAGKAAEISDQIQGALPPQTKQLEHENTLVLYASRGEDRSAAIDKALSGL